MTPSLQTKLSLINVETATPSMEGHIADFLGALKERITEVKQRFSSAGTTVSSKEYQNILANIAAIDYMSVREVNVPTPPNFIGNMEEYVETLAAAFELTRGFLKTALIPARSHFGYLLSNPELLRSVSRSAMPPQYVSPREAVEQAKNSIVKFHSAKQTTSLAPFGKLYGNTMQFKTAISTTGNLYAMVESDPQLSMSAILKVVDDIGGLLDKIHLRGRQDPVKYEISIDVSREIANVVFDIAQAVEFFGALHQMFATIKHGHIDPTVNTIEMTMQAKN